MNIVFVLRRMWPYCPICMDYMPDDGDDEGILRPKVTRAWFTVGYPLYNVPRLEADISNIEVLTDEEGHAETYAIHFKNVEEVLSV